MTQIYKNIIKGKALSTAAGGEIHIQCASVSGLSKVQFPTNFPKEARGAWAVAMVKAMN